MKSTQETKQSTSGYTDTPYLKIFLRHRQSAEGVSVCLNV